MDELRQNNVVFSLFSFPLPYSTVLLHPALLLKFATYCNGSWIVESGKYSIRPAR